jgi:subtilisin family serine protease
MTGPTRSALALAVALAALAVGPSAAPAGVVSQGALRMGADAFWSRGFTGEGETVAVVDLAFAGLDSAIAAGELPPRDQLTLQSFDAEFGLDGRSPVGERYEHGVRMAEIVHDIAPAARLVLVNYHTQAEFEQAVDWVIANGIPIVSHSNSFLTSPHDGTGRAARAVDRAAAAGVLWVNSAGNYAERHWAGRLTEAPLVIPLPVRPGGVLEFALGWRGAPAAQAELVVERRVPGADWAEVARSGPDPEALPRLDGAASAVTPVIAVDQGEWRLVARAVAGEVDAEIFSRSVGFGDQAVAASSVMTPGDAAGAIAVGAVPWTGTALASYSSQGPTDDGRVKPDLVAPTYVTSNPAWPGTAGTSAATPHVAGAAALIRQERRAAGLPVGVADLRADLLGRALDLGPPGPDPMYGAGMARLDVRAPRPAVRIGGGPRPRVRVRVSDDGTVDTIRVLYRGREIAVRRGPVATLRLPPRPRGPRRLEVRASDLAGNVGRVVATVRGRRR